MKLCNIIDKIIDKFEYISKKILSNKYIYYVLSILLAILIYYINLKKLNNSIDVKYIRCFWIGILISILIIIGLMIFNNKTKKMSIHKKFWIIGVVLGFTYIFAAPVFTQSDESFHFIRTYQVSKGHFISPYDDNGNSYDEFPVSIYDTLWDDEDTFPEFKNYEDSYKESKIKLDKNNVITKDVRASNYIFLNYLPQAIGVKIGSVLNFSPYLLGMLGRITNMLICISITALAIKLLPYGKKAMSIILIAPSIIAYNSSISADGLIIATSFLLISMVMKFMNEKIKFNFKWYILFLIIVAFVSTCKSTYLPIIGILIFIPYDSFKNKKNKWIITLSLIMFGIGCSLSWLSIEKIETAAIAEYSGIQRYICFFEMFINTMCKDFVSFIQNIFAGDYMYQRQVAPYAMISMIYFAISIIAILNEQSKLEVRYFEKVIVIIISLIVILLIAYALFAANTSPESLYINGIQGRYFVPLLLFIPFFIKKPKFQVNTNILIDISLILNFWVIVNMIQVFVI